MWQPTGRINSGEAINQSPQNWSIQEKSVPNSNMEKLHARSRYVKNYVHAN